MHSVERKSASRGKKSEVSGRDTEVAPTVLHSSDPATSGGGPAHPIAKSSNYVWTLEGINWMRTNMPMDYKLFHSGATAGSSVEHKNTMHLDWWSKNELIRLVAGGVHTLSAHAARSNAAAEPSSPNQSGIVESNEGVACSALSPQDLLLREQIQQAILRGQSSEPDSSDRSAESEASDDEGPSLAAPSEFSAAAPPLTEDYWRTIAHPPSDDELFLAESVDTMHQLHPDIEAFISKQVARHAAGIYDDRSGSDSPRGTERSHQLSIPSGMPMLAYPQCHLVEHRAWDATFSAPSAAQESAHYEPSLSSDDSSMPPLVAVISEVVGLPACNYSQHMPVLTM